MRREKLDLVLLFSFLACVGLTPFALVTYTRLLGAASVSREGFLLYLGVFFALAALSWLLTLRGMRRAWAVLDEKERRLTWRASVRGFVLVPLLGFALVTDAFAGPRAALVFFLALPAVAIVTRRVPRPNRFLAGPDVDVTAPLPATGGTTPRPGES